jgi:hypothetical protein
MGNPAPNEGEEGGEAEEGSEPGGAAGGGAGEWGVRVRIYGTDHGFFLRWLDIKADFHSHNALSYLISFHVKSIRPRNIWNSQFSLRLKGTPLIKRSIRYIEERQITNGIYIWLIPILYDNNLMLARRCETSPPHP